MNVKDSIYRDNRRWFRTLISTDTSLGLLSVHKFNGASIILSYENYKLERRYSYFSNIVDVIHFLLEHPISDLHFHEIINGNFPLKLYFDIDVESDLIDTFDQRVLFSEFIQILSTYLQEKLGIDLVLERDIVWLCCNRENKKSYHLLIDNYAFADMDEVKYVISEIKDLLPDSIKKWFDWEIYIHNKSFRILHSKKRESSHRLLFCNSWYHFDKKIDYKYSENFENIVKQQWAEYEASFITNISYCKILGRIITPIMRDVESIPLDDEDIKKAHEIFENYASNFDENTFKFYKVDNEYISYKRCKTSHCNICERSHKHENPYIHVKKLNGKVEIRLYCRRNTQGKYEVIGQYFGGFIANVTEELLLSPNAEEKILERPRLKKEPKPYVSKIVDEASIIQRHQSKLC